MESIAAFSLAASILQVVQFSLSLFSHSRALYKSSYSALPEISNADLITNDFVKRVAFMQASAALEAQAVDESLKRLYESCLSTSEELLSILKKLSARTEGKRWISFKQSLLTIRSKEQIGALEKRLEALRQEIHLCITSSIRNDIFHQTRKLDDLYVKVQHVLDQMENRPKELGFSWETGVPEDHLKIDDGLGPEYLLPVELCDTPKAFLDFLEFKYESKKLPGLPQVRKAHILVWEWNERHLISPENWSSRVVKGDRAVKLSFVMRAWQGPPRNRCMRCFKPRSSNASESSFKYCSSCKLAVHWIAPDYLSFELEDIAIFDQNTYRDHQVASRRQRMQDQSTPSSVSTPQVPDRQNGNDSPSIDLVCHRLTIKWEPISNIVHRYLLCRCVLRLSTPLLVDEKTIFCVATCPRHNTEDITFRDYSEFTLPCHKDPYFDQFGGYNAFWALLQSHLPKTYNHLGGLESITRTQLKQGYVDLHRMEEKEKGSVLHHFRKYCLKTLQVMRNHGEGLSPDVAREFAGETTRMGRKIEEIEEIDPKIKFSEEMINQVRAELEESPMGKELKKIIEGEWTGRPHWTIQN